ncbi:MAG TPA: hypothetical protein PLB92_08450 [Rhodoglobus sp.]|nr:hypothetical protein [Rhodoglobus sp.]
MTGPLHDFVRTQIEEMAGDQIRGALADGVRLGMQSAADVITRSLEVGAFSDEQAAALRGMRDAILEFMPSLAEKIAQGGEPS